MIKLDIQLFGGRGASSSYGKEGYSTGAQNKKMRFYDKTKIYKGMSVQDFENRVSKFKSEYIGLYDDNGKIIIAGTSYNSGSVAIPTTHPSFKKVNSMTHTHPVEGSRQLGGSFSGADVQNGALLGFKTVRARAPEKTYILRQSGKVTKSQSRKLFLTATQSDAKWKKNASTRIAKIKQSLGKKGKKMSYTTENKIYLGYGTRLWKRAVEGSGYEYIEIKKKYRK